MSQISTKERLLEVKDLAVHFELDQGTVRAMDGVSFHVGSGEIVGLIGLVVITGVLTDPRSL